MMDPVLADVVVRWGAASLLVLAGACMQGVSGVGFGVFAAPILAIIDPELVPGPMLFLGLVIAVLAVRRERSGLDTRGVGFAMLGRVPASVAAAAMMTALPVREVSIVFALLILAGVAMSLARFAPRVSPATMFGAGCISGFMGTITSVGTPPIALMYQNAPKATLRASLGGFLFLGSLVSIAALSVTGRFGVHDVVLGTWLIAPLWLGFWLSTPLARRLPAKAVRLTVLGLSALAALLLLLRQLAG
ncbi:sulfite exporter TauE/SafE family protein [Rhodoplanes sp. TEM]|uniref:Probable membrane transporter protein n=1 Tax=Rhodoplanes tepidamans TaxID=200616 RepID=A0ABT5J8Q7_RHOTP|nr:MULTISPECIES: sulfite exporter TauE/SafE family protein [Rhodoplanes]MDC7786030.1 sulfite exporter TauE/SafE family protein [Rhodoplanes tepidamans]MDC7983829.1 sulfite exporter TauE/SafE family protein [Rhodoplanes sp. TEM]MDQ0354872.1 putative membrane protein YfcA [Rhodoplanes tepidamans]